MVEDLVYAFSNDKIFTFERAWQYSGSTFGGPLEYDLSGIQPGPAPLHMIAELSSVHLPSGFVLPLIFGMQYDGCCLRYRVMSSDKIEILELNPSESCDGWPYANFPSLLPYAHLTLNVAPRFSSYEDLADAFPNIPDKQAADLIIIVPPPATLGFSLWGRNGDLDGVILIFECDLSSRTVFAYTQAS